MNMLAISLFVNKYYDLVFLFFLIILVAFSLFFVKKVVPGKLFKGALSFIKSKKGILLLLTLILLSGFVIRLYKINNPVADWHSFRQADTASVTRMYVERGVDLLYPRYHDISTTQSGLFNPEGYRFVELPIFNVIHTAFYNAFPNFTLEVWGRLVSIFSAVVTAYLLFLIGRKYLGDIGGILASVFYLFIPFNIYFTRVILPEPMAAMFSVWALWTFIKFVDKEKIGYLALTILTFSVALLIKPYTVFYGVALLYLVINKWGIKGIFKRELIVAGVLSAAPLLFWRLWITQYPEGIPFYKWTFNGDGIRFRPAFWFWIFGERLGKLILGIWGIFPFALGLLSFKKNKALIYYLGLGMLIYMSVVATANVRHDYYQTLIIPAIALMLARGTLVLWNLSGFNKAFVRIITTFSLIVAFAVGMFQIKEFYKVNRPEIMIAGSAVNKIVPKDSLIIAPYNGDTAFLYQTKRRGWPVVDRPINELIERGAEYFVSVDLNHPQTIEYMEDYKVIEKTADYVIIQLGEK